MVKKRILSPLPVLDESILHDVLHEEGIKEIHAKQIWSHAILSAARRKEKGSSYETTTFDEDVQGIPKRLNSILRTRFVVVTSRVVQEQHSNDGTIKLLIELQDGKRVESVIIPHTGDSGHSRNTLCVSSQVGCQMGCTFCATGTMGLKGDLLGGEILEQLLHATMIAPIRNVVFMGMGEPLNNYEAVMSAIRGMRDPKRFGISPKHITLSTVGVVPAMRRLTRDAPETQLALSLHAPNQELRNSIVPSAKAYNLSSLMAALDNHIAYKESTKKFSEMGSEDAVEGDFGGIIEGKAQATKKKALIEYVMLSGVNDTVQCGHELGQLLKGRSLIVNLIPYNATLLEGDHFKEPTEEDLIKFRDIIVSYGLFCTIRRHHGRDIDGACGQLVLKTNAEKIHSNSTLTSSCIATDIEDIGHIPRGATKAQKKHKGKLITPLKENGPDAGAGVPNRTVGATDSGEFYAKIVIFVGAVLAVSLIGIGLKQRMKI